MDKQIRKMLNDAEQELLRQTEPAALKRLDEDELLELHRRVRRARNKYAKLYRRRAAAQVERDASRGRASAANSRTSIKAETFEDALARVSRRLAREAWLSADRLRQERLAAARERGTKPTSARSARTKTSSSAAGKGRKAKSKGKGPKTDHRTPARARDTAAARASTKRKQAKRDAR